MYLPLILASFNLDEEAENAELTTMKTGCIEEVENENEVVRLHTFNFDMHTYIVVDICIP